MQLFSLSGIMTVFFCGIVMSHYTWHNVTDNSRVTTKYVKHFFMVVLLLSIICLNLNCFVSILIVFSFSFGTFSGMLLQRCPLYPRFSSSCMLAWMLWTSRSGKSLARGSILARINKWISGNIGIVCLFIGWAHDIIPFNSFNAVMYLGEVGIVW